MATQLRIGFVRRGARQEPAEPRCKTGKHRYLSESQALEALIRVRKIRVRQGDPRQHENHIYPCRECDGWHLSSTPVLLASDLRTEREQWPTETIEAYARRLERRIAEQRAQILSMLAVGHGGNNRQARKRIEILTVALGRMTAMWEEERRNREALVRRLAAPQTRWSLRRRAA